MRPETRDEIDRYVATGVPPGKFLVAVLSDKLFESFNYADDYNSKNMLDIVRYVFNHIPSVCWGSQETMDKWMSHKGLSGYKGRKGVKTNGKTKGKRAGSKS
jgi:hypothetical protein